MNKIPNCKFCGDIGQIFIMVSEKGMEFVPCGCKSKYSYGDMTKTEDEHRKNLALGLLKSIKHKKFIERGSREEFYDHISGFIEYPTIFLPELANTFENEKESADDLKRLVGLLKLDNYSLNIAIVYGIHPITGVKWDKKSEIIRLKYLTERNNDMIKYIESVIKVIEYKPIKNEFKSKYEDPNDEMFVG